MLDITQIRKEPETVAKLLALKGYKIDFAEFLELDAAKRDAMMKADNLKAKRNELSASVPRLKKEGRDTAPIFEEVRGIGAQIAELDKEADELGKKTDDILFALPNLPDPDVQPGGKEANVSLRMFGRKQTFDFAPKDHMELSKSLGLIDYERGAKLGGAGKWVYTGDGARLEWALLNYFIDTHIEDGYTFMLPPHMLNERSGFTAGQFPKFSDDVFWLEGKQNFMLPTAETALINLHRDEILKESELPKKYFSYTPCYRKEAGSYGSVERGMIRGYQFNKVEMVQFVRPEDGMAAFDEMVGKAEALLQGLGLHYSLSKL
ncbi:MAG: serine--tRNA ligase, partial [Oscillospiraceae bacterium]|nr:serine--tRNA ligase [Oscillospiraceae bacterium]